MNLLFDIHEAIYLERRILKPIEVDYYSIGLYNYNRFDYYNVKQVLYGACLGKHRDLVELMISKDADDLNRELYNACRRGYRKLADMLISKGATECDNYNHCHKYPLT